MAEMCGNGLRVAAKYVYDSLDTSDKHARTMLFETGRGTLSVEVVEVDSNGLASQLRINMGTPLLSAAAIPCTAACDSATPFPIKNADGRALTVHAIGMGNPHCVHFLEAKDDELDSFPVSQWGSFIERNIELFPKRTNVEFVRVASRSEVHQRTWERGSGETQACGTGACATVVAGILTNRLDHDVSVHLRGGILRISWPGPEHAVMMTGPATLVFQGSITPTQLKMMVDCGSTS